MRRGARTGTAGENSDHGDQGNGFYERQTEIAALARALDAAREGTGSLLIVEGPAGIGKSRLLAEGRTLAAALGFTVVTARGVDLERDAPFGVAAALFAAAAGAGAPSAERARLLSGHASLAAALFDPSAAPAAEPLALVRGLYWMTVSLASDAPVGLLIEVDDAQWADQPSLSYLAYLAVRITELPAVLLVAIRSGEQAAGQQTLGWLRGCPCGQVISPRALSPEAIARMVRAEFPAAADAFSRACAEVSGGNPFLAGQLLRALRADEVEPTADSVPLVRSLVPDSVLRSMLVRLARFGTPAVLLARAATVLCERATLRQAQLLAGLDEELAERTADALADAQILAPGEPLRFIHPLIASSVYADIPSFARARAHRRAADLLAADGAPSEAVAAHLLLTRPDGEQRTVTTLREAAAQAVARGDSGAAVRLLTRALAEPPDLAARGEVLLALANAELEQGDMGAVQHADEALRILDAPADRVSALATLGALRFNRGEHEAAATIMNEALTLLKPDDPALTPLLVGYLTATMFRESLYPLGTERLVPVIAAARNGHAPADAGLLAHVVLRLALAAGPTDQVRALAARATSADPLVDPASLGMLTGLIVQGLCCADELDEAERICDAALGAARRRGSLLSYTVTSYHRAIARYHRGELADALGDLDQAMIASREGWTAADAWLGALGVHVHVERGDLGAARDALALTDIALPGSMDLPITLFARARLALSQRRPAAALADAEAAGRILADGFGIDHPGFVPWQRTAALAARGLGQDGRARDLAAGLLERSRWAGTARALGLALRTQAAVVSGDRSIELLSEAAEALKHSPSALERAHTLVALGAARRRAGQRSAARPPLRAGLQLAEHMGAGPLTEAARRELLALGLRPRRPAVTGPSSLTPTEHRVAELAASGLTNRQTAEALFVTVKTVETHLTRTYQKLGISTRAELAEIVSGMRKQD